MNTKTISIFIGIVIVISGGAFYGGMKYGESKGGVGNFSRQNFQNLSDEERQQISQGKTGVMGNGISPGLSGEVIAKDEQSLTLKTQGDSSKIVFFSDSTKILKTTDGSMDDIGIGKKIMVSGKQNSDGSYTAQTIQEK
jgi:hypothetical protein